METIVYFYGFKYNDKIIGYNSVLKEDSENTDSVKVNFNVLTKKERDTAILELIDGISLDEGTEWIGSICVDINNGREREIPIKQFPTHAANVIVNFLYPFKFFCYKKIINI